MWIRILEPTELAKTVKTHWSMGMGPGLAWQESAGGVFGRVWNQIYPFTQSKSGPLPGYEDLLLTLDVVIDIVSETVSNKAGSSQYSYNRAMNKFNLHYIRCQH